VKSPTSGRSIRSITLLEEGSLLYTYRTYKSERAVPSGRAVYDVGLRPLAYWDCVFESRRGHGCLSIVNVACFQVGVSALSWSLVQRSPTDCGVSLCVTYKPQEWGGHGRVGLHSTGGKKEELTVALSLYTLSHFSDLYIENSASRELSLCCALSFHS